MRGINRVKRAGEQGGCGQDKWKPNHPFLVGLRQYLMSRHGKGRSEREVNQISSAVPFLCIYSSTAETISHSSLTGCRPWGKRRRVHLEERSSSVSMSEIERFSRK